MERHDDSRSPVGEDATTKPVKKETMSEKCRIEKERRTDMKIILDIINENKDGITRNDLLAAYRSKSRKEMTMQKLAIITACLIKDASIDWWTVKEKRGDKEVLVKVFGPAGSGKYKKDGKYGS